MEKIEILRRVSLEESTQKRGKPDDHKGNILRHLEIKGLRFNFVIPSKTITQSLSNSYIYM